MKIFEWLKEKIETGNNKKLITNLLIFLCVGIVFVIAGNFFNDITRRKNETDNGGYGNNDVINSENYNVKSSEEDVEMQLGDILSKVYNAGKVSVMITYMSSKELITDKDKTVNDKITSEKDNDGGIRDINELSTNDKTVMVNEQGGNSKPVVVKEINPEIKGVIVVAEGAKDARIKQMLTEAVQTVLGVPAYRVMVLETK